MSDVPEAREVLKETLADIDVIRTEFLARLLILEERIEEAIALSIRRSPVRRAKPTSLPITAELEREILRFAQSHPAWPYQAIAEQFGVNSGRISEIIHPAKGR